MLQKKIWIPLVIFLIGVAIGGTFWRKHIMSQESMKVYKTTPLPTQRQGVNQTLEGTEAEGGHFHADGTWQPEAHETDVASAEMLETLSPPQQDNSVATEFLKNAAATYPPFETHKALQAFLTTASEEEIYARVRDMYVARHYKKYPDCTEHAEVMTDAERDAENYLKELEHRKKEKAAHDEWEAVSQEKVLPIDYHSLVQLRDTLTDAEKAVLIQKAQGWEKRLKAVSQRYDDVRKQRPTSPKPRHTH